MSKHRIKNIECRGVRPTGRNGFFKKDDLPPDLSQDELRAAERAAYHQMKAGRGKASRFSQ